MKRHFSGHYYEIQKRVKRKSWVIFGFLALFYFLAVGLVLFALLLSLGIFLPGFGLTGNVMTTFLWAAAAAAVVSAVFHFADARKNGARFIRKRMQAEEPDPSDRYHKRFVNTVEEMRIAAGIPEVNTYIIPVSAVNSMALMEADNTPSILVTEGLLADFTRDELQAVIAHELGHISRGDSFYLTLICSVANVFERLKQASEPDTPVAGTPYSQQTSEGGPPLFYLAVTLSTLIMHLFSTMVSREREFLADSAAVELNRNPAGLARAVYKAHIKNSFVGDFNLTYSPLFLVPPESRGEKDGFFARLFNSHPPLMKRIEKLSRMIPAVPADIVKSVWESRRKREAARIKVPAFQETRSGRTSSSPAESQPDSSRTWMVRHPKGRWLGPYCLADLLGLNFFTSRIQVKNTQEDLEGPAADFPQIRNGMIRMYKGKPINPENHNRCPRCRSRLQDSFYEGVEVKICRGCGGILLPSAGVGRILSRREMDFSEHLKQKAREFKKKYLDNPVGARKLSADKSPAAFCPGCGVRMLPRPFTCHYLIPVDKCLSCGHTWFDADELEILQILIESREDQDRSSRVSQ